MITLEEFSRTKCVICHKRLYEDGEYDCRHVHGGYSDTYNMSNTAVNYLLLATGMGWVEGGNPWPFEKRLKVATRLELDLGRVVGAATLARHTGASVESVCELMPTIAEELGIQWVVPTGGYATRSALLQGQADIPPAFAEELTRLSAAQPT